MAGDLTVDSVLAAARTQTGLDDLGDDWFLGPLGAWVEDLHQPILTEFGRAFLTRLAVRDVARRLRVIDQLRRHPEIEDVVLPPIVYVTGLARSGTTLLHNLLAQDRRARVLRRWELLEPVPPPTAATYHQDPRIAEVQAAAAPLRGTLLEQMHWIEAEDPEECPWGYIDAMGMLGQAPMFCMPRWRELLFSTDWTPAFEGYRRVVQLLLWQHPVPPGGFLVLKAPQVVRAVTELGAVFPEARFVVTDRDPFRCITSLAVLVHSIVEPFCTSNPVADDGRRNRVVFDGLVGGLAAVAAATTLEPTRVVHVPYPALVDDPAAAARSVLTDAGPELDGSVASFLAAQRAGRRPPPPLDLDPMGYDHDAVLADPTVAAYCERFGIEPERVRRTGAAPPR